MLSRFNQLAWRILERKLVYYHPELVHNSWLTCIQVSDTVYDKEEVEYLQLAKQLNLEPTAQLTVQFDLDKACCRLVLSKLQRGKKNNVQC